MRQFKIILCLFLFPVAYNAYSQNVFKTIDRYEKAVFTIVTYGETHSKNDTASGFFISSQGIALVPTRVFKRNDSGVVILKNNKTYSISQIISTHLMANLCMVKINNPQEKDFDFIIPTKKAASSQAEVLLLCDHQDAEGGLAYGEVRKVYHAPYLNRFVEIDLKLSQKSDGSPVINRSGELIGVVNASFKKMNVHYHSMRILDDSLWVSSEHNVYDHRALAQKACTMNRGITMFMHKKWVEAAKMFSLVLKNDSLNSTALIMRGEARRKYHNSVGAKDDFGKAERLAPDHFLLNYYRAHDSAEKGDLNNELLQYIKCLDVHSSFAPALVEFGLLVLEIRNDQQTALDAFSKAITENPLFADAYYERSRLTLQFYDDNKQALEDINRAIYLNRKLSGAYSIRGTVKMEFENYFDAIQDFDKALELEPDDTHALFNRGISYYNIGMKKKSCADWNKAGALGHYKAVKFVSRYCNKIVTDTSDYR